MSKNPLFNPLLNPPEPADFGKGFTLCILKFLEHTHQHDYLLGMPSIGPFSNVHLWFNGSSDHFYELKIPPGWETARATREHKVVNEVRAIAKRAIEIGHGCTGERYSMADYEKAIHGCTKVLIELDSIYEQSLFWNLAGIVVKPIDDEKEFLRNATEFLVTVSHGPDIFPEVRVLTFHDLVNLVRDKAKPVEINRKVFEIAVAFDIEVGITDANIGAH